MTMRRISRETAIKRGLATYYQGTICPRGHQAPHYVSNRTCVECIDEKYRERYGQPPKRGKAKTRRKAHLLEWARREVKRLARARRPFPQYSRHATRWLERALPGAVEMLRGIYLREQWFMQNPKPAPKPDPGPKLFAKKRMAPLIAERKRAAARSAPIYRKAAHPDDT